MRRIDRETVQKILDTADIVDVVSDFVSLKRRGANYIGLCPFHNERTPSFSVSKSKGICKCFSCGKGGSPVNFLMELEQMSYHDALRYLAKKYHIEIKEHEMTDAEREAVTERESMLAVSEFALQHFEHNLNNTDDGRDIGLSYFHERGINDAAIKKFRLGYSLEKRDDLASTAKAKGYNEKYLVDSGLCIQNEQGKIYDRFKGRVMYPILSVSGKVLGFGGRTLRKDKEVAKYVNSPESVIYRKSYELYGLYQAKQAIVKKDKCILVEGYMDVISMSQSGIENVVASSGTSLTEGQIRLIHRFTENVTVIYDSDPAGIKASLRGIDMLLAEGMNIKVVLLPEGDDPDSFAQNHSTSEIEDYLAAHEQDFIAFKTAILLKDAENDPHQRSNAIKDIVRSISVIPDEIVRSEYIKECSRRLRADEQMLTRSVAQKIAERIEKEAQQRQRQVAVQSLGDLGQTTTDFQSTQQEESEPIVVEQQSSAIEDSYDNRYSAFFKPFEREVLRYVLKYGMVEMCESCDESGNTAPLTVMDYVWSELNEDDIHFTNRNYSIAYNAAFEAISSYKDDLQREIAKLTEKRSQLMTNGIAEIQRTATNLTDINAKEQALTQQCDEAYFKDLNHFKTMYVVRELISSPDDVVRRVTTELISEKYVLSKVHTKYAKIETEQDKLNELVPRAIYEWKDAILENQMRDIRQKIKEAGNNAEELTALMSRQMELKQLKSEFAKFLGERIVAPRK
ncbi:MAG: DNA primase [Muribaculaceae bacterium]|nr:DNA primase [Muribaculaceae bacterium]